ncbi:uncharacterized protein LOC106387798 isoform X2 [Brassica napus]|uniref:uncharacterized protein LOC106387798 isoform X2 n=1 Tax=Brassica napus TaxID=3708 RepID=UPI000871CA74|nr:uncharacterized protein LOC106387798 isoform X2 [Brassica napus]
MRRELSEEANSHRLLLFLPLLALSCPGGPMKTNKAAALAKFLERKLQDPNVLSSIDPDLIELAVKNSRHIISSRTSSSGRRIQHVVSFVDVEVSSDDDKIENTKLSKKKKKKKKKKNKKHKITVDEDAKLKRPNKKLKL